MKAKPNFSRVFANDPQTPGKIARGEKLFNDKRFSSAGEIRCVSCHAPEKAFTDSPRPVSEGVRAVGQF